MFIADGDANIDFFLYLQVNLAKKRKSAQKGIWRFLRNKNCGVMSAGRKFGSCTLYTRIAMWSCVKLHKIEGECVISTCVLGGNEKFFISLHLNVCTCARGA